MLVALRRPLNTELEVALEIPSAPVGTMSALPVAVRSLTAKVLRVQHAATYNLVGLKFSRPLEESRPQVKTVRRKQTSMV
jgi:hypothetical protein